MDFLNNKILQSVRIDDNNIEDLGTLKNFCERTIGEIIQIDILESKNISLFIKSIQQLELKIYCSSTLSNIIKETGNRTNGLINYKVLRITRDNGSKYIRLSQSMTIELEPDLSIEDATKNIKGSIRVGVSAANFSAEPFKRKYQNPDDIIKL